MCPDSPHVALPYAEFAPSARIGDYVSCFWRSYTPDGPRQATILPDGCVDLIWQAGKEPFIAGPMTVPVETSTASGILTLGVRFKPGAAAALLGVSAAELRDLSVPLQALMPRARHQESRDQALTVAESLSLPNAIATVNTLIRQALPLDSFIADACRWFVRHPGQPAAAFIAGSGLSERQARRRFQEHVGYGPKTLQRILRMQRVLWILSRPGPSPSLAHLAQIAGFADQAHLTRELRALTGQLPSTLATGNPQSAVADLFKTPLN